MECAVSLLFLCRRSVLRVKTDWFRSRVYLPTVWRAEIFLACFSKVSDIRRVGDRTFRESENTGEKFLVFYG